MNGESVRCIVKRSSSSSFGVGLLPGFARVLEAAPRPALWSRWERNDPSSTVAVGHAPWKQFLDRYLVTGHPTGINRVRYGAVEPADRMNLEKYLSALQTGGVSEHLRKYARGPLAEGLTDYRGRISYEYDWSVNEVPVAWGAVIPGPEGSMRLLKK